MSNNLNAGIPLSRPKFDVALIKVEVEAGDEAFAATFKQVAGAPYEMPSLEVGACIILEANGETTHVGIATDVSVPGKHPKFSAHFFPALEARAISKRAPDHVGSLPKLAMHYLTDVTSDEGSCLGNFSRFFKADAEHVLAQLGPIAPPELQEVFWSEAEIASIEASFTAQERYAEKATALLQSI